MFWQHTLALRKDKRHVIFQNIPQTCRYFRRCLRSFSLHRMQHPDVGKRWRRLRLSLYHQPDRQSQSLDPQSATDASSKTIIRNLYEGLLEMDDTGTPQLAAASSYTVSPDGLIYTFLLRKDRYWFYDKNGNDTVDDGETWLVTASDYAYTFQRIFDPQTQSPYAETFSCLHNAEAVRNGTLAPSEIGVRAVSDDQLQFTLDQPNAQFLAMLTTTAAMPCNEEFFLQTKGSYGLEQNAVASCGAFYMRLWFYDPTAATTSFTCARTPPTPRLAAPIPRI